LEKYIELENASREYEGKNVLKNYKLKEDQLEDLKQTLKTLDSHYQECVKQTEKEKADVDQLTNVKEYFKGNFDSQMSKEQEEYLDALNQQEIAKKDLDGVTKQKETTEAEINHLKGDAEKLKKIYAEQDELLSGIFDGNYGSELEYKLEMNLDTALDKKQRISVAKYKWSNARVLLQTAVNQMAFGVKRWTEVGKLPADNMQARYTMATEARNNFIAASQNITSAQRYLQNITFPYCKPEEVTTLNRATNNIYTDMQTNERHTHAFQCYNTTHRRAAALLQWFDHVIKNTITKDYDKGHADVDSTTKALRKERLRLIKEKVKESTGKDVNIKGEMDLGRDDDLEPELANIMEADRVSQSGDLPQGDGGQQLAASNDPAAPTPMPLNELAPAPNQDDIFGDIDELKKQHEKEMEEFNKAQDVNKARMEQGLQEKLRARRSRKQRLDAQEKS